MTFKSESYDLRSQNLGVRGLIVPPTGMLPGRGESDQSLKSIDSKITSRIRCGSSSARLAWMDGWPLLDGGVALLLLVIVNRRLVLVECDVAVRNHEFSATP